MKTAPFAPARAHGRHLFAANDPLTSADRALAAMFAGPLDGELTEEQLLEGDSINNRSKADGSFERARERRALALQIDAQSRNPNFF